MFPEIRKAIESLYDGRMTVLEYLPQKDAATGITRREETEVLRDIPCRLSHSADTMTPAVQTTAATELSQKIRVFYASDVVIKPGSKLVIRQNGAEQVYCASGVPRVYAGHAEVDLTDWERWV